MLLDLYTRQADLLGNFLMKKGVSLGHNSALEAIAVLHQVRSWGALASILREEESLVRGSVNPGGIRMPGHVPPRATADTLRVLLEMGLPVVLLENGAYAQTLTGLVRVLADQAGVTNLHIADFTEPGFPGWNPLLEPRSLEGRARVFLAMGHTLDDIGNGLLARHRLYLACALLDTLQTHGALVSFEDILDVFSRPERALPASMALSHPRIGFDYATFASDSAKSTFSFELADVLVMTRKLKDSYPEGLSAVSLAHPFEMFRKVLGNSRGVMSLALGGAAPPAQRAALLRCYAVALAEVVRETGAPVVVGVRTGDSSTVAELARAVIPVHGAIVLRIG